jgi:hypothetical protein
MATLAVPAALTAIVANRSRSVTLFMLAQLLAQGCAALGEALDEDEEGGEAE